MLQLATKLPPGALIGGEVQVLSQALQRSGGARFVARDADLVRENGTICGWREANGAVDAVTAAPNSGNSRFDPGPPAALVLEKGVNCGFTIPAFAPQVEGFTLAVIYRSEGEAKTLAAVSTGPSNNTIFLSESEGQLFAKDKQGAVEVSLPVLRGDKSRFALLAYDGRGLTLISGGTKSRSEGKVPAMAHPGDFFIACRANRAGLAKTLGAARLQEVYFWPDRSLPGSDVFEDRAALAALDHYFRWAC